jgi:hypothetical protein
MGAFFFALGLLLGDHSNLQACNCTLNQNSLVVDQDQFQIKGKSSRKCVLNVDLWFTIEPETTQEFLNTQYVVTIYSTSRGVIDEYVVKGFAGTLIGSRQLIVHESLTVRKKEEIWVKVSGKGNFLFTMKKSY